MSDNKTTLVILAAGIGSRFGGGVKQLEPVGPNGELIIDYSIHDAIMAGFNKIIFIIRHDIEKDFKDVIGDRVEKICAAAGVKVCYVFQDIRDIPIPFPEGRTKPWGTGHAVLACDGLMKEAFAVINADDYYGKEGFVRAAEFLKTGEYGMVGYVLKNTLSEHGGVTRGICSVEGGKLVGIDETKNIRKKGNGAEANGIDLDIESLVSMNFWCFPAFFMKVLKKGFPVFLNGIQNPLNDEYLLPIIADDLLKKGTKISVLKSTDKWFGVTYKEDKENVVQSFKELYKTGVYQKDLYQDIIY